MSKSHITSSTHRWLALAPCLVACLAGVLWLHEWGHNGPTFAHPLAEAQALTWAGSLVLGIGIVWLRQPLGQVWMRWATRWMDQPAAQRARWAFCYAACGVAAAACLHWAHKLHQLPALPAYVARWAKALSHALLAWGWQPVTPAVTAELLRWPACLLLAWLLYRAAHGRLSGWAQARWATTVLLVMVIGFWVSRDKGPLLVTGIAMVILSAAAVRQWLWQRLRTPYMASAAALAVLLAGLSGILWLLPVFAPEPRSAAWSQPFNAPLEYLAEITWFLQAAGWQGFGSGHTPWCGYTGAVLGRCLGLPAQTQSDYTFAALAGLWGAPLAWAVAACVAIALLAMLWLASLPRRAHGGVDLGSLTATAGGLYLLLMLAQWATTTLANVGLIPLTGVGLPFVSWGRAAALSLAVTLALVWPRPSSGPAPAVAANGPLSLLWAHALWVGTVFAALVLLALPLGLMQRYHAEAPSRTASGRLNPWLPLPGCLYASDGPSIGPCLADVAVSQNNVSHHLLPQDQPLLAALSQLGQTRPLVQPLAMNGLQIPRRDRVLLTLSAGLQQRTQQLADCLTHSIQGPTIDCDALVPAALRSTYAERHEAAAVRSLSVVTVRVEDGAILAAAHQRSPCSAQQMAGQAPSPGCPPTSAVQLVRPGRQAHQVFHADDMIDSTIKPLLAEAVLRSQPGLPRGPLTEALLRSDTAYFIDQLLCWPRGPTGCTGLSHLQGLVNDMRLDAPMPLWQADTGTAMTLAGMPLHVPTWPPRGPSGLVAREWAAAQACSQRPAEQRWRGCGGEHLAATLAPLWGQGGARSHPLAVAGLYLRLAAAARGASAAPSPHLWAQHAPAARPAGFTPEHARVLLQALREVPLRGTAASACRSVLGPAGCAARGWAMKTGTGLFPHHTLTADQRGQLCQAVHQAGGPVREQVACALYPMKWAVLLEDPGQPDARLTVVLAERNWSARSGLVDAGDDRAPNVAAQAAVLLHAPIR